jgi:hypothetical protein
MKGKVVMKTIEKKVQNIDTPLLKIWARVVLQTGIIILYYTRTRSVYVSKALEVYQKILTGRNVYGCIDFNSESRTKRVFIFTSIILDVKVWINTEKRKIGMTAIEFCKPTENPYKDWVL